jgi:hypothetical protein
MVWSAAPNLKSQFDTPVPAFLDTQNWPHPAQPGFSGGSSYS